MDKRSTHYGDVIKWLEKVIDSCEIYQQTHSARQLVRNFEKQLMRDRPDKYWKDYQYSVIWPLESRVRTKRQSLIYKMEE
jgi:hypothetical protein